MTYEINTRIKHLSERIKLFKEKRQFDRGNPEILAQDIDFRFGDLLVELLYFGQLQHPIPNKQDLELFHSNYTKNRDVCINDLFDKHWLRHVSNRVEVPYQIIQACKLLISGFPVEFGLIQLIQKFLSNQKKETFSLEELRDIIADYNKSISTTPITEADLKDKGIIYSRMNSSELELHPHATYLLLVESGKDNLLFIDAFMRHFSISGDAKWYFIKKSTADRIVDDHKRAFKNSFTMDELLKKGFLKIEKDDYLFKLSYDNHSDLWTSLSNLVAGKLWSKLKRDTNYNSDNERLDIWLDKILINYDYPSFCINYIPHELRADFINLLEKRILEEEDLLGCSHEIEKISLEQSNSHARYPLTNKIQDSFQESQSAAEKYRLFTQLDRDINNLFHDQSCRKRVDVLLHILFRSSDAYENPTYSFPSILKFLNSSKNKPYLVWQVSELITYIRPEIMPYLFAWKGLEELGALLIPTFSLSQYSVQYDDREGLSLKNAELRTAINKEGLLILLNSISNLNSDEAAPILAKSIIEITKQVYFYPSYFDSLKRDLKEVQINAYKQTWEIATRFRIEYQQFVYKHGKDKPLLIFHLLIDFSKEIYSHKDEEPFNEFYTPDLWRVDSLSRVLGIIDDRSLIQIDLFQEEYKKQIRELRIQLINWIEEIYNKYFSIKEVEVKSGTILGSKRREIRFQSSFYGLDLIQWGEILKSFDLGKKSVFFQKSLIQFDAPKSDNTISFGDETENKVHRLRFHLRVMLTAYLALFDEDNIDFVLVDELERNITSVFCGNSQTSVANSTIDIFNKYYDSNTGENLFFKVIETSNSFKPESRRLILDAIVKNDQFERILAASNILISEGDRVYLMSTLTNEKLDDFLKNSRNYQDIEGILIYSVNKELKEFSERIIKHIDCLAKEEDNVNRNNLMFHIKLLLAYRNSDMTSLKTIEAPKDGYDPYSEDRLSNQALKKYYEILLLDKNGEYDEALKQTSAVVYERKEDPVFQNLKFNFEIAKGRRKYREDIIEGKNIIREALNTFNSAIKSCAPKLLNEQINKDILINRLYCFHLLEQDTNFDFHTSQLKVVDKYKEEFASIIMENKIRREQLTDASNFIEELTNYHKQRSGKIPSFIEGMRDKLSTHKEHIKHLRQAYKDILCLSEGQRIKALPDVVTQKNKEFNLFLLGELMLAISSLQQKLNALRKKGNSSNDIEEDKITDFLELIMNARLSAWQMQWYSQSRSGSTGGNSHQLARPDLSLNKENTKIILEALRIYSYSSVTSQERDIEEHILKSFDATKTKKYFYNLVYYQANKFVESWTKFKSIVDQIKFPDQFERLSSFEDLTTESTSDLKIGLSKHKDDVIVYYLFINLA